MRTPIEPETTEIKLESACFDLYPTLEQHSLDEDLVAMYATSHAGERIYMIVKRHDLLDMFTADNKNPDANG